jgi:hypothetical protein
LQRPRCRVWAIILCVGLCLPERIGEAFRHGEGRDRLIVLAVLAVC